MRSFSIGASIGMWRPGMTAASCLRGRRLQVSFRSCYGLGLLRQDGLSDSCNFAELASPTVRLVNGFLGSEGPSAPLYADLLPAQEICCSSRFTFSIWASKPA